MAMNLLDPKEGTEVMARPTKEGLDYFPIDIDIDQDDKLVVPIAKFGMLGLGIIVKLMMEVYRNGYFYNWSKREQYVFSNKVNVDINTVIEIVNECIEWGFFNHKAFDDHQILTSKGFQKRYIEASKRRKAITFIQEYTLIDLGEASKKVNYPILLVDVNGNRINEYINPDKADGMSAESTQSKVKESKEKLKEKEIKDIRPEPPSADQDDAPPEPSAEGSGKRKKKRPEYSPDSPYYRMAVYFKQKIDDMAVKEGLTHLTDRTNLQTWADDFRKLVELDKQSDTNLIRSVMDWVVTDGFWKSNVLSAEKFRVQFPKLVLAMRRKTDSGQPIRRSGGNQKPYIPIIERTTEQTVTEEEHQKMIKMAEEMQAKREAREREKSLAK